LLLRIGDGRRILSGIDAASPLNLRPNTPFTGRLVTVEPLEERHREELRAAAADTSTYPWTGIGYIPFDEWFGAALPPPPDEVPFAIVVDGRAVGSTRYLAISPENLRAEIGWTWLERPARGTGVNVETKLLLLENAFERCGLQRVEFKTDALNEQSRGALTALGATFEGIHRKHQVLPDRTRDSAWFSILDDEWPEVKARLLRRLEAHTGARA
jgi:N-acetyltransferase